MSVFFNYSNPVCILGQAPSSISHDPSIVSLKELLIYELKQIAYYILKLEDLSIDTKEVRDKVIYFISLVVANLDFRRNEFNQIIEGLRFKKNEIEKTYIDYCNEHGTPSQLLKPSYKLDPEKSNIVNAIHEGERQALLKNTILSKIKKNLYEIIVNIIETSCLFITELDNYSVDEVDAKLDVMQLLNITNFPSLPDEKWIEMVLNFNSTTYRIMKKLKDVMVDEYGPVEENLASTSTKPGHCILASGHFFRDLRLLLEATENENINIYTHDDMLMVHSLKQLNHHKHLAGHYQKTQNNTKLNFASFPGPILISKNSLPNIELIRGRIYTTDDYPSYGMSKIENYDFSQLIQAAKDAEGFHNETTHDPISVGYNKELILKKLHNIFDRMKSGELKHLYIIDILKQYPYTNDYLEELFSIMPKDHFAISLSYPAYQENVLHINSFYGYSLIYLILEELRANFDLPNTEVTAVFTQCNAHTLTHILNFKHIGIKNLFLGNCCPLTINPSIIRGLEELFEIKYMGNNPAEDFEMILNRDNHQE